MSECLVKGCRYLQTTCVSCGRIVCTSCLPKETEWIDIKKELPPCDGNKELSFAIAYHSIYGVGVAWFHILDKGCVEEMEEDFEDTYICSAHFIKNTVDGNYCIDDEEEIDIFENSPHFKNLGTITHWMPLPEPPR